MKKSFNPIVSYGRNILRIPYSTCKRHSLRLHLTALVMMTAGFSLAVHAATGNIYMNGANAVPDVGNDGSGKGWTWKASTATLTLSSDYPGELIDISCAVKDSIQLVYSGNVTITSASLDAFSCSGNLTITEKGSGGTLMLSYTGSDKYSALTVYGSLTINSGTLKAVSAGTGDGAAAIHADYGVTIGGTANVTATVTGANAGGIQANSGNITLSTSGTVTANGKGTGYALLIDNVGKYGVYIRNATVNLTGNPVCNKSVNIASGTLKAKKNDSTPIYLTKLTKMNANEFVTGVAAPVGYNFNSLSTDTLGNLYFWLPAGKQTVTLEVDPYNYTGSLTVAANHTNTVAMKEAASNKPVTMKAIGGVTPPVTGAMPVTTIKETAQFTGTVSWNDESFKDVSGPFMANRVYRANIDLKPKTGYTLIGVAENFFTVEGATKVNYLPFSTIMAVFPATVGTPTGMNDLSQAEIKLYPNPARENISLIGLSGDEHITLCDISGRIVYSAKASNATEMQIPVSGLANSLYFVRINTSTATKIFKVIK